MKLKIRLMYVIYAQRIAERAIVRKGLQNTIDVNEISNLIR